MRHLPKPEHLSDAILITHKGCVDGSGCAIMFLNAGGKRDNIRFVGAGAVERFIKESNDFKSGKFLIFADIGVNLPKYADILEKRGNLVLLDHHKTSLHMKDRYWALIDADDRSGSRCGTKLLRDYLIDNFQNDTHIIQSNNFKNFSDIIDDFDRWVRKIPEAEMFSTFMSFVGQDDFISRFVNLNERINANIVAGRGNRYFTESEDNILSILYRKRDEAIAECLRRAVIKDVVCNGMQPFKVVYVVTDDPNTTLLLDRLLKEFPEANVGCQIMIGIGKVSLRSRGDIDVSKIAKYYGGGGHHGAAGHMIPPHVINDLIEEIH